MPPDAIARRTPSGASVTRIPRSLQSATAMLSKPAPSRAISSGGFSHVTDSGVTSEPPTITASQPSICSGRIACTFSARNDHATPAASSVSSGYEDVRSVSRIPRSTATLKGVTMRYTNVDDGSCDR